MVHTLEGEILIAVPLITHSKWSVFTSAAPVKIGLH
jgi:hypothetical protein